MTPPTWIFKFLDVGVFSLRNVVVAVVHTPVVKTVWRHNGYQLLKRSYYLAAALIITTE